LVGRGLYEIVGWTFCSPTLADRLRLPEDHPWRVRSVALENPLSEEQSLLRPTLLGSLLESAARNQARGVGDLRLFEVGTVFMSHAGGEDSASADRMRIAGETGVLERRALAVLLSGRIQPRTWGAPESPSAGFFAVKGVLEGLCDALRVSVECASVEGRKGFDFLHPGRRAILLAGGGPIGWLGELHPLLAESFELRGGSSEAAAGVAPVALELDLGRLLSLAAAEAAGRSYTDLISFPALRRDLAVVLPTQVPAAKALAAVRQAGGALLGDAEVFDVYSGPQVGEGRRSLALSLSFRASDRTLSEEDVAPLQQRIVTALEKLGGQLRG